MDEEGLEIIQSEEYLAKVKRVSDFINGLPLSHADNDKLISLMLDQNNQARTDAFLQGFDLGINVMKDSPEETPPIYTKLKVIQGKHTTESEV
jgi:hypothetical protein